jgi:Flp pilus assembly protein TadG
MRNTLHQEKGQSVVLITLVLIGLVAMMGLIFDGGNAYFQRRRMQNAADAGALAGGRRLALANSAGDASYAAEVAIKNAVNSYVTSNGGSASNTYLHTFFVDPNNNRIGTETSYIGSFGYVPSTATGVSVTISTQFQTYFLSVVNINGGNVGASALVQTGAPSGVANLFPLTVPTGTLTTGNPPPGVCQFGVDDPPPCQIWGENQGSDASSRQWTSFQVCGPGGANFLSDILNGTATSGTIEIGDSICTSTGSIDSMASSLTPWVGKDVIIPIFDCTSADPTCPDYNSQSQGSNLQFHVANFGVFKFEGYYFANNQNDGLTQCSQITAKYLCGQFERWATDADLNPTKTCPYDLCGFQMRQ